MNIRTRHDRAQEYNCLGNIYLKSSKKKIYDNMTILINKIVDDVLVELINLLNEEEKLK